MLKFMRNLIIFIVSFWLIALIMLGFSSMMTTMMLSTF